MFSLSEINIYPIKSLGGIGLNQALVQPRGLQYDRRWMLADEAGRFVSQREIPEMALLDTALEPPYLTVFSRKNPAERIQIPLEPGLAEMPELEVQIWKDHCPARVHGEAINQWFSDVLGQRLRLVYMPDSTRRPTDGRYAADHHVSFADGFPFMILSRATVDELNSRLDQPLPMNRFRPNFVVEGSAAFDEDRWGDFQIGDQPFRMAKPCGRCIITTINQETAQRTAEPLQTLATYRKWDRSIYFGMLAVWLGSTQGQVRIGDEVRL